MRKLGFTPALIVALTLMSVISLSRLRAGVIQTYLVLYTHHAVPSNAETAIAEAGGMLVHSYPEIGVAIAKSDNLSFHTNLVSRNGDIFGAAATESYRIHVNDDTARGGGEPPVNVARNTASTGSDNLSGLQWDMKQIHVPEAHAITSGSSSVVVGNIDTGIDYSHPDLAANVDFANSVSCLTGVPDTSPNSWLDENGHGTHTAGIIAAANNGFGIIGVAPNTKIAAIKAGNKAGLFSPEAVVCAFMWAGTHHLQIVNSSYNVDPTLFNCAKSPRQQVIWEAERRAVQFAMQSGSVVVSAVGNYSDNVARPGKQVTGPDDPTPAARRRQLDCTVVPAGVSGVIGVGANGSLGLKSFYSNFGTGVTQVVAPGGDSVLQSSAVSPNGRVLSTWPVALAASCLRQVTDCSASPCTQYCYLQGTSMASAHVAGVAALMMGYSATQADAVVSAIQQKADQLACRDLTVSKAFPSIRSGSQQVCQGDETYNSFFGHGQINALRAVAP